VVILLFKTLGPEGKYGYESEARTICSVRYTDIGSRMYNPVDPFKNFIAMGPIIAEETPEWITSS
jgi:hypothetical protein